VQVAVIDFGDAMLGDPLWDLVSLHVSALQCDKTLLVRALEAYHGCALAKLTHIMGLPRASFAGLMMCYTLLHPCRALEQALSRVPRLGVCSSWEHLAAELWGLA
jgi:aminoglycoside/choline kinase family phosphotransferase